MIVKLIEVHVKPGHLAEYLKTQEIWNRETSKAPACLGFYCGQDTREENLVHLFFFWRSREEYDSWMATEHDKIASQAGADDHYEKIIVRILELSLTPVGIVSREKE